MKAEGSCHHLPSSLSHLKVGGGGLQIFNVAEPTCDLDGYFIRLQI